MGKCLSKQAGAKGEDPDKAPYTPAKDKTPNSGRPVESVPVQAPQDGHKSPTKQSPSKVLEAPPATTKSGVSEGHSTAEKDIPQLSAPPTVRSPTKIEDKKSVPPVRHDSNSSKPHSEAPKAPEPKPEPTPPRFSQENKFHTTSNKPASPTAGEPVLVSQQSWSTHTRSVTSSSSSKSYTVTGDASSPLQESDIKMEFGSKPFGSTSGTGPQTAMFSSGLTRSTVTRTAVVTTGDEEPSVSKEEKTIESRFEEGTERPTVASTVTKVRTEVKPSGEEPQVQTSVTVIGDPEAAAKEAEEKRESISELRSSFASRTSAYSPMASPTSPTSNGSFNSSFTAEKTENTSRMSSTSVTTDKEAPRVNGSANGVSPPSTPGSNEVHINANVVVSSTNGSDAHHQDQDDVDEPSSEEPEEEVFSEPTHLKNLKKSICQILPDFSQYNDHIRDTHPVLANTRGKALQAIDRWLLTEGPERGGTPRLLVVTADVGMGKTCLVSDVCRRHNDKLAACHFFHTNSPNLNHNNLREVLLSLARSLCDTVPGYISMIPRLEKLKELISDGDANELAESLLYQPLNNPDLDLDSNSHLLFVLDALDECSFRDRQTLLDIVKNLHTSSPEWLYIMVSTRNEESMLSQLRDGKVMEMKRSIEAMNDTKKILREPLGKHMDRISLDGGLTHLAKQTEASFVCARILKGRLEKFPADKKIALREADGLFPTGFDANVSEILTNTKDQLMSVGVKDAYKNILSVICASREPLHIDFISDIVRPEKAGDVQEALKTMDPILEYDNGHVDLCSEGLREWLTSEQQAQDLVVDVQHGHTKLATLCMQWLEDVISNDKGVCSQQLRAYALKHAIYHLLEVPKQHEQIAKVLCSLQYAQEKLKVDGVNITHLLNDYKHEHSQEDDKTVSMKEYLKKQPKLSEEVKSYEKFLLDKRYEITQCLDFLFHVAANYPAIERIQSNARVEIGSKPWIEDVTAVPESQCQSKAFNGSVKAASISADGRSVAVVSKDEDYNVRLHIVDTQTSQETITPVDIKSLDDRVGLQAMFMADTPNVFVGSLTTFLSSKNGKKVLSGLDVQNIQLKEKFSIECSAVSAKHFVCGLTTFPWGGRSLHLVVFDMRTKKCLKTIEVLRFRFGGSAQFGIRGVAVARDRPLMAACIRQSTKPQLRMVVWNISKFQVTNSIDVNNDTMTKCLFVGDHTLLIGGSIRSTAGAKAAFVPIATEQWQFKDVKNKSSHVWDNKEMYSLFSSCGDSTLVCRWFSASGTAIVEKWDKPNIDKAPDLKCKIRGLMDVAEVHSAGNTLMFVSHDELYFYNIDELERMDKTQDSSAVPNLSDVCVDSLSFIPKSDIIVMVGKQDDMYSAYLCDLGQEDVSLYPTPFVNFAGHSSKKLDAAGQFKMFRGVGACSELCFSSADGNAILFNGGDKIHIWDRVNDTLHELPPLEKGKRDEDGMKAFASPKDNIVAVVYGQAADTVVLYDIRSRQLLRRLEHPATSAKPTSITDVAFVPSNGVLVTYCRDTENSLNTWNVRTGEKISQEKIAMHYGRMSPSSDRIVLSAKKARREGQLILRNTDNKYRKILALGDATWLHSNDESDLEFSQDGTVLVGVCSQGALCRVWNAGNGETLRDLPCFFSCDTDVVGLVTNTHALFYDDRLIVIDIASGMINAILPLEQQMERKTSRRGLRVSPRCEHVVGATNLGQLCAFHCHNFNVVKRRTSLQRVKSFQK